MNKKIPSKSRSFIIEDFIKILQANRYISEYFLDYENESIYLILIKLYLGKSLNSLLKA